MYYVSHIRCNTAVFKIYSFSNLQLKILRRNMPPHLQRFSTDFLARNPPESSPKLGLGILSSELSPNGDKISRYPCRTGTNFISWYDESVIYWDSNLRMWIVFLDTEWITLQVDQQGDCYEFWGDRWYPVANATIQHQIRIMDTSEPGIINSINLNISTIVIHYP